MVTLESFVQSLKKTKIKKAERNLIAIFTNDKLLFILPKSGYHHTWKFLKNGKVDAHLTKEGLQKDYTPQGIFDFREFLSRCTKRLENLVSESNLEFPWDKARKYQWRFYHLKFSYGEEELNKKKIRMKDFLSQKIEKRRIPLKDIMQYKDVFVYTKNGTWRGVVGKMSGRMILVDKNFMHKLDRVCSEEWNSLYKPPV